MLTSDRMINAILAHRGPITAAQIVSSAQYEQHRDALLKWSLSLKAQRRISVGSDFTLLFENEATVWMQIQEELRWVRQASAERLRPILAEHNGLIAPRGELRGCLFMHASGAEAVSRYQRPGSLEALALRLHLCERVYVARALEANIENIEPVTYLSFVLANEASFGPDRLTWSSPTAGSTRVPLATSTALQSEAGSPLAWAM